MKIITNKYSLRLSKDYLKNINVEFDYMSLGVFEMCQHNPMVIISDDYHEVLAASKKYPNIVFMGADLKFPNIDLKIPDALLDELSTLTQNKVKLPSFDIAYFNNGGKENIGFINQLQFLGNLKIMGPGYCIDELDRAFPQRLTPSFYKYGKIVAATSKEEALKGLFMAMPVIYNGIMPYTYSVNDGSLNIKTRSSQVNYAWNLSHTNIWAHILTLLNYEELADKLKSYFNIGVANETRTS